MEKQPKPGDVIKLSDFQARLVNHMRDNFPEIRCCHAYELVANYLGFKTYAALIAKLNDGPMVKNPDKEAFIKRCEKLGYYVLADKVFESMQDAAWVYGVRW